MLLYSDLPCPRPHRPGQMEHCWAVQELLSFHVPPLRWTAPSQRGCRSQALQRLISTVVLVTTINYGVTK